MVYVFSSCSKLEKKLYKVNIIIVCYFLSLKIFYFELTESGRSFMSHVTLKFHHVENCICYVQQHFVQSLYVIRISW